MRFVAPLLLALTLSACGLGATGPTHTNAELDALFVQLAVAADQETAAPVEMAIWRQWADAGTPTVRVLMDRARQAESQGDAELAIGFLDRASAIAPDYAEPWNRRANIAFQSEDYSGAVLAIQETLKREPRHFAALTGLGLIYEELGQQRAALEAFRAALVIHPNYEPARQGVQRLEPSVDGRDA